MSGEDGSAKFGEVVEGVVAGVILDVDYFEAGRGGRRSVRWGMVLVLFLGFNGFLIGSLAVAGCCSALEYSRQDSTTT